MAYDYFEATGSTGSSSSSPTGATGPSVSNHMPGFELRAVLSLAESHSKELGDALRAIVAFGPIVTDSGTYDIDLLEIVDGWSGQRAMRFTSSSELPLRGELTVYLVSSEEFENPSLIESEQDRQRFETILNLVRKGFRLVIDRPSGYFHPAFRHATEATLGVTAASEAGPLSFMANRGKRES